MEQKHKDILTEQMTKEGYELTDDLIFAYDKIGIDTYTYIDKPNNYCSLVAYNENTNLNICFGRLMANGVNGDWRHVPTYDNPEGKITLHPMDYRTNLSEQLEHTASHTIWNDAIKKLELLDKIIEKI